MHEWLAFLIVIIILSIGSILVVLLFGIDKEKSKGFSQTFIDGIKNLTIFVFVVLVIWVVYIMFSYIGPFIIKAFEIVFSK